MAEERSKFWENTSINVIINVIRTVTTALIGLLLVPYYIDTLGVATYGIIPLATTISSYILIISDSLVSACSRYTVIAIQSENPDEMSKVFNTAFVGIGKNVLLLIPIILLFSYFSTTIFSISDDAVFDVRVMFLLILSSAAVVTFSSAFNSIFSAYNKLYILYAARIIYSVSQVVLIILAFTFTVPSLIDIGIAYFISALILMLIVVYKSLKLCPGIKIRPYDYDKAVFREMGSLGVWTIVMKVGTLLYIQMSLIMTNILLGPESEGSFAIVVSLISMMSTACISIVVAIEPIVYRVYSDKDVEKLIKISTTAMRVIALVFAFPVAFVIVFSPELLTVWVGSEFTYLSEIITIAYVAELIYISAPILDSIPIIFLKLRGVAILTLIFGIVNLILAVVLVSIFEMGIVGIITAWSVSIIVQTVLKLIYDAKVIGAPGFIYIKALIPGYVMCAVSVVLFSLLDRFFSFTPSWLTLILLAVVLFAVYSVIIMLFVVREEEKRMISAVIPSSIRRYLPSVITGIK